jgi:hypothetical protein
MVVAPKQEVIERLYIELDGVTPRLRRGSVPMEETEIKRAGDVYREVKVGAVFAASRGPERSGLAPGVFVDHAGEKHYMTRRCKAEDFGGHLWSAAAPHGPGASRSVPEIEMNNFISNADHMRFPAFRAQGIHVGSRIAEAA